MKVVSLASVRGAPGVTTTAILLASTFTDGLVIEADLDGGVLAVRYGLEHEQQHLDRLRQLHPTLTEIDPKAPDAAAATRDALRRGELAEHLVDGLVQVLALLGHDQAAGVAVEQRDVEALLKG